MALGPWRSVASPQKRAPFFPSATPSFPSATSGQEYKSRLEIGGDYTRVKLKPHGHSGFKGNLGGAQGIYEYRPANHFYGAALVSWKKKATLMAKQESAGSFLSMDKSEWATLSVSNKTIGCSPFLPAWGSAT